MSITSITQNRSGQTTTITVVSNLTGPSFYWYLDGAYVGKTTSPSKTFNIDPGSQAVVSILDSNSPTFDPIANAPTIYPARRTLVWTRSTDAHISRYQVQQQVNGGAWTTLGYINDDGRSWTFSYMTPRLTDLASYVWRVIPLDAAGNAGTPIALAAETIVRAPDAPGFAAAYNHNASNVTFTAV